MSPSSFLREVEIFSGPSMSATAQLKAEMVFSILDIESVTSPGLYFHCLAAVFVHQPGVAEQVIFTFPVDGHFIGASGCLHHECPHTLRVLRQLAEVGRVAPV